jgi:hypothetical protein
MSVLYTSEQKTIVHTLPPGARGTHGLIDGKGVSAPGNPGSINLSTKSLGVFIEYLAHEGRETYIHYDSLF